MLATPELDLARAFAHAYRDIDEDTMRGILAPDVRIRILMPRGFAEHQGPDSVISGLRKFAERWRTEGADEPEVELLEQNLMKTGRLVSVGLRLHLRSASGDATAKMVMRHLLAISDGKIALVDELCTGVMPDVQ